MDINALCKKTLAGAICLATTTPALLHAQDSANARLALEEIVVTARRAEEGQQSTPVAVTALSMETMELAQVTDVSDLERAAPNLTISTGAPSTPGFANITMRGMTNMNANTASDAAVGLYVDGVYIARSAGALLDLDDVQRLEVLRGPQGTLFGRSTTGGAINIITNQPTDTLQGRASVEIGNFSYRSFRGMLNLPMGENLAARLNYKYMERDGIGENRLLGQDLNDMQDNHFVRGQIKYTAPSGNWDLTLAADYNEYKDGGQVIALAGVNPIAPFAPVPGVINALRSVLQTDSTFYDNYGQELRNVYPDFYPHEALEQSGYSAHLNAELGAVHLESISAYRDLDTFGGNDLDGTPVNLLWSLTHYKQHQISQELKFSGALGERIDWVGGLYYFKEEGTESSIAQTFGLLGQPVFRNLGDIESTSRAVYGQMYYKFTDALRLTAGYRQTWDKRVAVIKNTNPFPTNCVVPAAQRDDGVTCAQTRSVKFDYPAYVLGLDYQVNDDVFIYANTSAASMSGGWNLRLGAAPAFKPEDNKAFEVGVKADWLDNRLRTNLALFYSKPEDIQRQINTVFDAGQGPQSTSFVQNAGDATIKGAELEITAVPWQGMVFTAAAGYTDGEYDSYTEIQRVNAPTTLVGCTPAPDAGVGRTPPTAADCLVDRSDEAYAATPEWTFNVGATQTVMTGIGELNVHVDYAYIDEQIFSPSTAATQQPAAVQAAYAEAVRLNTMGSRNLINAAISLDILDTGLNVSLWGRNLGDRKYVSRAQDFYVGLGIATNFVGDPRTYGITLTYDFE